MIDAALLEAAVVSGHASGKQASQSLDESLWTATV
jgi:hypothetical protein